jgi:hypothetical protein
MPAQNAEPKRTMMGEMSAKARLMRMMSSSEPYSTP